MRGGSGRGVIKEVIKTEGFYKRLKNNVNFTQGHNKQGENKRVGVQKGRLN